MFYIRIVFGGELLRCENEVVIEIFFFGFNDFEMFIIVDGVLVIRIMNLNWRFRGNEVVIVSDGVFVEIFWDVYDWLFEMFGLFSGLFVFKFKVGDEFRIFSFNGGYDGENDDGNSGGDNDNCDDGGDGDELLKYCYVLYVVKV